MVLLAYAGAVRAQGFISPINTDDISVILNVPATIVFQNGDTLQGKLTAASLVNNYLKQVTLKTADGSKQKISAPDMRLLRVQVSTLAKMAMVNESANSIFRTINTNFNDILVREYIIFEQALRATKKEKPAMMQLLNPGFDQVLKVYADPNANKTGILEVNGVPVSGGSDRSYLFVKPDEQKVVIVRKGSYRKNFTELYGNCQAMVQAFEGDKLLFQDVAGHVFAYNHLCKP